MTVFVPASPCLLARKTLFTSIKNWCRLMFAAGFRPTLWLSNLVADKPIHKHTSENWMREDLTIVDMSPTFTNNTWPPMRTDAGPANDGNPPLKMGKWTTDVNALITEISPCFHSDQSWLYRSCFQNLPCARTKSFQRLAALERCFKGHGNQSGLRATIEPSSAGWHLSAHFAGLSWWYDMSLPKHGMHNTRNDLG